MRVAAAIASHENLSIKPGRTKIMPDIDRNLLVGVIALQDDYIDQAQFADVCAGWAMRMEQPLGLLLKERGWIDDSDLAEIERKLARKLKKHRNDPKATLASMADAELRNALQTIAQPEIRNSLHDLPPATGHQLVETLVPPADQRSSLRYTLSRMHAQGGLGKIWVARDTDLNREVALKEMRIERSSNPEAWRRFMKEAQVTGQLEHPNIVPVYELARRKEDDQPFYTMRFVRGQTLRGVISDFHVARGRKPADRLQLQRQLLEPFIKVCQAIGYAHSRGVIHRDLKPENIVIGAFGEVMVLDWGLAKILDDKDAPPADARVTVTADADTRATQGAVGTPAYMAPEQANADSAHINARTDIYGLGGILYEILTGQPPARGDTLPEVLSRVTSGRIDRARTVEPTVAPALDAICAKALALRPADRYATAEELADDVRRWTLDEPVSVYKDPPAVRLGRWARRHRTAVGSAAALLVTALAALAAGLYFVDRERQNTDAQRKIAVSNARQATDMMRLAQDSADTLLAEVADVDLAEIPQMESARKRLLERARARYEQFSNQRSDDPQIQWGAARAMVRLADIQSLLGENQAAEQSYQQALTALDALAKNHQNIRDDLNLARDEARARHGLGVLLKDQTRYKAANDALAAAVALRQRVADSPDKTPDDEQALADSVYQMGALLARQGAGRAEDSKAYDAALAAQAALAKRYQDRPEFQARLARYRNNQGILLRSIGKNDDALAVFQEIIDLLKPQTEAPNALPGARWQYARASNNLAAALISIQRLDDAQVALDRAANFLDALDKEFPQVAAYKLELAAVLHNRGQLALLRDDGDQALAQFQRAVALVQQLHDEQPSSPTISNRLAQYRLSYLEAAADPDNADNLEELKRAVDALQSLASQFPDAIDYQSNLLRGRYLLARTYLAQNQVDLALQAVEPALASGRELLAKDPRADTVRRDLVELDDLKVQALLHRQDWPQAAQAAAEIVKDRPDKLESYVRAAALLTRCGRLSGDESHYKAAVATLAESLARDLPLHPQHLDLPEFEPLDGRPDFNALRDRTTGGTIRG